MIPEIEIWSNHQETEFAVRLTGEFGFRASSSLDPTVRYVKLLESLPYLPDIEYQWNYVLHIWMERRGVKKRKNNLHWNHQI